MKETVSKSDTVTENGAPDRVSASESPSVTFESITFSDDSTIELSPEDVVVFVGPNNAGKSVALKELEEHIVGATDPIVIKAAKIRKTGTQAEFERFFDEHVTVTPQQGYRSYRAYGLNIDTGGDLRRNWPNNLANIRGLFCTRMLTETRINDSDPKDSIDQLEETPSLPIQMMLDDDTEATISGYFREAFGQDLILPRSGGIQLRLRVGQRLTPRQDEDRVSTVYLNRMRDATRLLEKQGDGMRSFASVILHLLASVTNSLLIIDEPEAFLHPPQARLIGKLLATKKRSGAQLFVSTHSPHVLEGLIDAASDNLRVLRIQREGEVNRIKELKREFVKQISTDALMKYSSVMSGVFHERVIICEGDSDCMFYSSIVDLEEVHGEHQPDILFVHAGGKARMANLANTLRALGVPVDIIADIDVLRDEQDVAKLVNSLGGDGTKCMTIARSIKHQIDQLKPSFDLPQLKDQIVEFVEQQQDCGDAAQSLKRRINSILDANSSWEAIKRSGIGGLPHGQPTTEFQRLDKLCKQIGLWIVPVGVLEGFCKPVSGRSARWVQNVLESRDLAKDPDLARARDFVHEIWASK